MENQGLSFSCFCLSSSTNKFESYHHFPKFENILQQSYNIRIEKSKTVWLKPPGTYLLLMKNFMESANMKKYAKGKRKCFAHVIKSGQEQLVTDYFCNVCLNYDDVYSVQDIAVITGLTTKSLMKMLKSGDIKSLTSSPRYIVPKPYFLEFTATERFRNITTSSKGFVNHIKEFKKWKILNHH